MSLGDRDLVDGELTQVFEPNLGEATRQVAFLNVLDDVPADAQVLGDIADGHAAPQIQGVAHEGEGVATSRVGEWDLDLSHYATGLAFNARDRQNHEGGVFADRHGSEAPLDSTAHLDLRGPAGGATTGLGLLVDGENRLAVQVVSAGVLVATNTEAVIQQTGGHADLQRVWSR